MGSLRVGDVVTVRPYVYEPGDEDLEVTWDVYMYTSLGTRVAISAIHETGNGDCCYELNFPADHPCSGVWYLERWLEPERHRFHLKVVEYEDEAPVREWFVKSYDSGEKVSRAAARLTEALRGLTR